MQSASITTQPANGGAHGLVSPGHSGRLRYADPQDLPSFPSIGLKKDGAAASAAASLGWESHKSPEIWRPDRSASASAAAVLARDYKMAPMWEPQRSAAGSKAAILAAESAGRQPKHAKHLSSPPSLWGNSAANQAVRSGGQQQSAAPQQPRTDASSLARKGSLSAARGAMAGSRPRSKSSPTATKMSHPGDTNPASSGALSAATIAHRPSMRQPTIPIEEGGAVPYTTMDRQMYTSRPPVQPEVDEQRRNDIIHASAVAMAKQMYSRQQMMIDTTRAAHGAGHRRTMSSSAASEVEPTGIVNLQEAAYRLAQERLAKLHEEHSKNREFREYYSEAPPPQSRFTIRSRLRRRSSSDGDVIEDRKRSQQIRQQMSLFTAKLSEVDEQKRQKDRAAVLAAAQRNVKAQLQGMDAKLYAETGKVPPSMLGEWESKAHAAALARSETRRDQNAGKVDIGGGKFMDRSEVDQIAARRVQPVLDEINEKAEKERERQLAAKMEEEKRKEELEKKRVREKEIEDIHKKLKDQQKEEDKLRAAELKQQEKARKEDEKIARAEQKRLAKEEKSKGKELERVSLEQDAAEHQLQQPQQQPQQQQRRPGDFGSTQDASQAKKRYLPQKLQLRRREQAEPTSPPAAEKKPPVPQSPESDAEATSPGSRVRTWWMKISRPRAKSAPEKDADGKAGGFIGGAALANLGSGGGKSSNTSLEDENRSASIREVAMAGKHREIPQYDEPGESSAAAGGGGGGVAGDVRVPRVIPDVDEVSPVSTPSSDDKFVEARDNFDSYHGGLKAPTRLVDPAAPSSIRSNSPAKESRFVEKFE